MIARSAWVGVLLVGLTGCGVQSAPLYYCEDPDIGHKTPDGEPDPCHFQNADGGDPPCAVGQYVHWQIGWDDPSWLWFGPEDQAPDCPDGPISTAYEGHTDLVALPVCEACTCQPPTGSCALPSTLIASMSTCGHFDDGPLTSFNAPTPWDGHCDSTTQTPDGAAHSLTIDPITMTENGCAPGPPVAAKVVSLYWNTFARACDVTGWAGGPSLRSACIPDDPLPAGFHLCIFQNGENECPTEPGNIFTEQHFFYKGVEDNRQCSACTCGAPTGSACKAKVSIYEDATCSALIDQKTISSVEPVCLDIALPGQALRSKFAGPTTYLPGTCPPGGGDGSGIAIPTKPATLCCRP